VIVRTNSKLASLGCALYPYLAEVEYHDSEHVEVKFDYLVAFNTVLLGALLVLVTIGIV